MSKALAIIEEIAKKKKEKDLLTVKKNDLADILEVASVNETQKINDMIISNEGKLKALETELKAKQEVVMAAVFQTLKTQSPELIKEYVEDQKSQIETAKKDLAGFNEDKIAASVHDGLIRRYQVNTRVPLYDLYKLLSFNYKLIGNNISFLEFGPTFGESSNLDKLDFLPDKSLTDFMAAAEEIKKEIEIANEKKQNYGFPELTLIEKDKRFLKQIKIWVEGSHYTNGSLRLSARNYIVNCINKIDGSKHHLDEKKYPSGKIKEYGTLKSLLEEKGKLLEFIESKPNKIADIVEMAIYSKFDSQKRSIEAAEEVININTKIFQVLNGEGLLSNEDYLFQNEASEILNTFNNNFKREINSLTQLQVQVSEYNKYFADEKNKPILEELQSLFAKRDSTLRNRFIGLEQLTKSRKNYTAKKDTLLLMKEEFNTSEPKSMSERGNRRRGNKKLEKQLAEAYKDEEELKSREVEKSREITEADHKIKEEIAGIREKLPNGELKGYIEKVVESNTFPGTEELGAATTTDVIEVMSDRIKKDQAIAEERNQKIEAGEDALIAKISSEVDSLASAKTPTSSEHVDNLNKFIEGRKEEVTKEHNEKLKTTIMPVVKEIEKRGIQDPMSHSLSKPREEDVQRSTDFIDEVNKLTELKADIVSSPEYKEQEQKIKPDVAEAIETAAKQR